MWDRIKHFFDTTMFAPHGICLQWEPEILAVHIVSDAIIALSYFSIPFALGYFVSKRKDVEFGYLFWAFAIFIMACGVTHIFSIYTLWVPVYGLEGLAKAVTALASIVTAIVLWPLIPRLLLVPSPAELQTARALLEEEARHRREAEALLSHRQKMEAIGQLTGGVAHDFNNLLMVISGNLEMAHRAIGQFREGANERLMRLIQNARHGAERATTLTHRLLAFARKQPFDTKTIDVTLLLKGMSEFLGRTLGEQIDFQIVPAERLWRTETDPHQLEAALLNLVVNARDAMSAGGTLFIKACNSYIDEEYARLNSDVSPGEYVLIAVTDTGIEMDGDTREKAFEPFFSTKETGHGTGLGLSQVYGFARQSGGFATIESELGKGTTVKMYLPRSEAEPEQNATTSATAANAIGCGETILVVEDDENVRRYVVETLEELNYHVLEAGDYAQAIQTFQANATQIRLLLTDVVMPGKNGRLLSEELLQINPKLKVLFMTGYSRNAIVHQGRLDRGVELLQKPVTQTALATKIRTILS